MFGTKILWKCIEAARSKPTKEEHHAQVTAFFLSGIDPVPIW
jgi:hypothetical protein